MKITVWMLSGILFTGTLMAQQGTLQGAGPRQGVVLKELADYLNLTESQIASMRTIETAMRDALKPLVQEMAAKGKALRDEYKKTDPDANVIEQLKKEIASLRDSIRTLKDSYQDQLLGVLTADQTASLVRLEQALRLVPVARAAAALNLIDAPNATGFRRSGLGRVAGTEMGRRQAPTDQSSKFKR